MKTRTAVSWLLMPMLLVTICAPAGARGRGTREDVTWADVPAAVQKTIEGNIGDGVLIAVEKRTRRGSSTYTGEVRQRDGKTKEIEVAADGKLLGIEVSDPDPGEQDTKPTKDMRTAQ